MKFSAGDRVVVLDTEGSKNYKGKRGSIISVKERVDHPYPYEVVLDGEIGKLLFAGVELSPEPDAVNHPSHYTWLPNGVEVIDITKHFNFTIGNALKYVMRAGRKGDAIEDLKKARWYIDYEIKQLEGKSN